MKVCVLTPFLDAFKGGNHLPLLGACHDTRFTILTNQTKPANPKLPGNVTVETLGEKLGKYYYGFADMRFASAVLKKYPPSHEYWKQFDVIHLNQTMGIPLLELKKTGKPVLYTVHHPVSVDRALAMKESGLLGSFMWNLKYAMLEAWQRIICRDIDHIMTVSNTVKSKLIADYKIDAAKIHIVPNGVDGSVFTLEEETEFDVCAVGSLMHPRKGFTYLLEAYKKMSDMRIADVGRRSVEQQKQLEKLSHVTVLGMVEHDQLVRTMQRSKVLISTSLYEGFGLSLIEALACGRPVVAFDSGAVREVLSPIDPMMITEQRDVNDLVGRIEGYLDTSMNTRMELRSETLALYSMEQAADALKALYKAIQ